MYIAIFVASILSLLIYILFTISLFNKGNDNYNFANHFSFELFIKKGHRHVYLNIFLFLSSALFFTSFLLNSILYFSPIRISLAIFALCISLTLVAIFYLPLSKLKERCICSIMFFVANIGLNGLIIYQEIRNIKLYENNLYIIPLIISILILLVALFSVFNPRLFNFTASRNEEGVQIRPKYFQLALGEWLMIFTFLFAQIYLIF